MGGVLVIGWVTLVYATAGDPCRLYSNGNTEKPGGSLLNISGWTFERLICYRLYSGTQGEIITEARDTHGDRYRITNTSGNDYFVPTKTQREWESFVCAAGQGTKNGINCLQYGFNDTIGRTIGRLDVTIDRVAVGCTPNSCSNGQTCEGYVAGVCSGEYAV